MSWDGVYWGEIGHGLTRSGSQTGIRAFAVHDAGTGPALYAAGLFDWAGTTPARGIARWHGGTFPRLSFVGVRPGRHQSPPGSGQHTHQRSLSAFRNWVRGGLPYLCTPADAYTTLAAVDAVYRSAASGRREEVYPAP